MSEKIENVVHDFLMSSKYRIHRHVLLQIAVFFITINIFWDTPDEFIFSKPRLHAWIIYFLMIDILLYFNAYILVPRFLLKNKYLMYLITSILFSITMIATIMVLQILLIDVPQPANPILGDSHTNIFLFFQVLGGVSSLLGLGLVIAGVSAFLLFRHWIVFNKRAAQLESSTLQSELDFLKSQINPHFLFNMINNANIMVDEDPKQASMILSKLNDMLRYQFNDSAQDKVLLSADIDFLRDFLELEKTRRDNFEYTISIEGEIDNIQIPPLLFITFVENAIKHNNDSNNLSYVHIYISVNKDTLIFDCKNSKPQVEVKRETGGLGLANIVRRLDLLYGDNYSLKLNQTETTYQVYLELKL